MSNRLVLGLFAEGVTDDRFLPRIIERTAQRLVKECKSSYINVAPVRVIPRDAKVKKRAECILQAARNAVGCHILIVHCDADDLMIRHMKRHYINVISLVMSWY